MARIIDSIPKSLKDALITHKCIPFIGSGLSLDFGIPTWNSLIERLKTRCESEKCSNSELISCLANEGEYLQAAQKAKEKLGKNIFKEEITNIIKNYDHDKEPIIQRLLWEINPPLIITTNFDTVLEDSIDKQVEVVTPLHKSKLTDLLRDLKEKRTLFKVHGSIDIFESLIFTEDDYNNLYNSAMNAYQLTFTTSILNNKLLFIGFSLEDEAVLNILSNVKNLFDGFSGNHYALQKKKDLKTQVFWKDCNINIIEYDNHSDILPFIKDVVELVNATKNTSNISVIDSPADRSKDDKQIYKKELGKNRIPDSNSIPDKFEEIKKQAIGDCIVLATCKLQSTNDTWRSINIIANNKLKFYKPKDSLASIHRNMEMTFRKFNFISTPRLSLLNYKIQPRINYMAGSLYIETELTDWTLIHGLQNALVQDIQESQEVKDRFWASINSLIVENKSLNFPHHLAIHCLLISQDNKVIFNRRVGVENQRNKISASFEEQMQFPFIYPTSENKEFRYFDGDSSPLDTIIRGAYEELNINLNPSDIRILALCMESSSVAANFIAIAKSQLKINEIYNNWQKADDKQENKMIPPDISPNWEVDNMLSLISNSKFECSNELYSGFWHASSQTRILLGLIADFGMESIMNKFEIPPVLMTFYK